KNHRVGTVCRGEAMRHFVQKKDTISEDRLASVAVKLGVFLAPLFVFALATYAQTASDYPVPPTFTIEGVPAIKNTDVEHLFFDPSEIKNNLIWDVDRKSRSILITDERSYIYRLDAPMTKPQLLIDGRSPNMVRVSPRGGVV